MATGPTFVVEFLYRGRDATDEPGQPSIYQVILGRWVDAIDGGRKLETSRTLRPVQATGLGFPLATITGEVVAAALLDKDAADIARDAMQVQRDAAKTEKATAIAARDAAIAATSTAEAARNQALADLAACGQAALTQAGAAAATIAGLRAELLAVTEFDESI